MIRYYILSLFGGPPSYHRIDKTLLLMISSVFAGYIVSNFPIEFLNKFKNIWFQILVFILITLSQVTHLNYEYLSHLPYIIGDSIMLILFFKVIEIILLKILKKNDITQNVDKH